MTDKDALWQHPWRELHLDAGCVSLLQPWKKGKNNEPHGIIPPLTLSKRTVCIYDSTVFKSFYATVNWHLPGMPKNYLYIPLLETLSTDHHENLEGLKPSLRHPAI